MQNFSQKAPCRCIAWGTKMNEPYIVSFIIEPKKIQPPEGDCIRAKEQYNGA